MDSKLIIFLALASLAQGSHVPTLSAYYQLSEEKLAAVNLVVTDQIAIEDAYDESVKDIFGIFYDMDTSIFKEYQEIYEALFKLFETIDTFLQSLQTAFGTSTSIVEEAKVAAYEPLYMVANEIATSYNLAHSGPYSEYKAEIESSESVAKENLAFVFKVLYDAFRASVDTTNTDIAAVIDSAESTSNLAKDHFISAIWNGFKIRSVMADEDCTVRGYVNYIEDYEAKAVLALQHDVEHRYAGLRAIFIYSNIEQTPDLGLLLQNQKGMIAAFRGYKEGNEVLFNSLRRHFAEFSLGQGDAGELDYSRDDGDIQVVILAFDAGDHAIFDSALTTHPTATEVNAAARKTIEGLNREGDEAFYKAIALALAVDGNLTETLEAIEVQRHAAVDPAPAYTELFLSVVRGEIEIDSVVQETFDALQNLTIIGAQDAVNGFLDAVGYLAESKDAGEVTNETLTKVEECYAAAIVAVDEFSAGILTTDFIVQQILTWGNYNN